MRPTDTIRGRRGPGRAVGRLAGLLCAAVLVFAGGWSAGLVTGRTADGATPARVDVGSAPVRAADDTDPETASAGLTTTRAGYGLRPVRTVLPWREPTEVAFTITGSDGSPVRSFDGGSIDVAVVRRDDAGYTTLRAVPGPDGVWRAPVTFPGAGVWRLYAGFTPTGGPALDLGTDLFVPGPFGPFTFDTERRSVRTGPYQVRLDGELLPGGTSRLYATVGRDGAPVGNLEPVDGTGGAFGRMVAVRQGDLARYPLRPEVTGAAPGSRSGPGVGFVADVPSTGSYRLFLVVTVDGAEQACEFTVDVAAGT